MKDYYDENYANEKDMNKSDNNYREKRKKYAIIATIFFNILIVLPILFFLVLPIYHFSFFSENAIPILIAFFITFILIIVLTIIFTVLTLLIHFKLEKLR